MSVLPQKWRKKFNFQSQFAQFGAFFLSQAPYLWKNREGHPNLRIKRTLAPQWGQVFHRSGEKKNFKVNLHDLVHSFCLRRPHKVRRPISEKMGRGRCLRLLFSFLSPPFFSSFFLFSLCPFSFLFSYFLAPPFSDPGGRGPKAPPRYAPVYDHFNVPM